MVSAIFWGIFPVNDNSPHNKILELLKIKYKPDWKFHLILGTTFYVLGVLIAQTKLYKIFGLIFLYHFKK